MNPSLNSFPAELHRRVLLLVLAGAITGCTAPHITSPGSATGTVGQPFQYQITADGRPTSFSATVPTHVGLDLDTTTGLLSGTPTIAGAFPVRLGAANRFGEGTAPLALTIAPAETVDSHDVLPGKELLLTAPAILDSAHARVGGAWHIRQSLARIAGPGVDLESFAEAWFSTWAVNTQIDGADERFGTRPWVAQALREAWRENRIQLIAIVNRLDLAQFPEGDASREPTSLGEGRFVYEARDAAGNGLPLTLIFEYALPREGGMRESLAAWARRWHALGRSALGQANSFPQAFFDELLDITSRFSAHGQLNQIRSNEFLTNPGGPQPDWELREFHALTGPSRLAQVPVAVTPAFDLQNSPTLAQLIRTQERDILAGKSLALNATQQAAVSRVPFSFQWEAPGAPERAKFIASFNSCSGCHAGNTGTTFQHLGVRAPSGSPFMTRAIPLAQPLPPLTNSVLSHHEMAIRALLLARHAGDERPSSGLRAATSAQTVEDLIRSRMGRPH
ncbi:MAG: hypothetical protein IT580_20605 [Verrucomicrobiales bacterium]|nr:hypothetical protein [Verrucomicrobiales bacterium]